MLDTSKVLLFIKSVSKALDREKVGLLLETDEGLTTDWAVVKEFVAVLINDGNGTMHECRRPARLQGRKRRRFQIGQRRQEGGSSWTRS